MINVDSILDVKKDGNIYYCKREKMNAMWLNGTLFTGGIGKIFKCNPTKIKTCKYKKCLNSNCQYYHPKKDVRNYVYHTILNEELLNINSENLEKLKLTLSEEEILQFRDRCFHNIIIAFELFKHLD